MLMWASCARNARRSNKKREGGGRPRIVKAASHKHPHNDLCDERSFGDSFFVLLRPIFLSLRTMRTCIYFLRPPPPPIYLSSLSLFLFTLCSMRLSFPRRSFFIHYALVLRLFVISPFFSPIPPAFIFLSPVHRRSRFSSARQGIPRSIFFQRGSMREHAAPSWGACINIRLIMLDATIMGPVGHRCAQVGSLRVQP